MKKETSLSNHTFEFSLMIDSSMKIEVVYFVRYKNRFYHGIKASPKHTQAILIVNGLICGMDTVVKHVNDIDNQLYAYRLVTGNVIKNLKNKSTRKTIWDEFDRITKEMFDEKLQKFS